MQQVIPVLARTLIGISKFQSEYQHDPAQPLLGTFRKGTQLLFIPSIFNNEQSWKSVLLSDEYEVIDRLRTACSASSKDLLLNFRLNSEYTIKSALKKLAIIKDEYHDNVLHLRWSYHTRSGEIPRYNSSRRERRIIGKEMGETIQPGEAQMVQLVAGEPKTAFNNIVVPLTKIIEYYLKLLPEDLFPKRIEEAGMLFDLEFSHVSLNFYWKDESWEGCHNEYFTKNGEWDNTYGFGAVLVFGYDIDSFDQRYLTYALRLPCPGWSLVIGNCRELLHAVHCGSTSLRMSLVITNQKRAVP